MIGVGWAFEQCSGAADFGIKLYVFSTLILTMMTRMFSLIFCVRQMLREYSLLSMHLSEDKIFILTSSGL